MAKPILFLGSLFCLLSYQNCAGLHGDAPGNLSQSSIDNPFQYLFTDDVEFTSEFGVDDLSDGRFSIYQQGAELVNENVLFGNSSLAINLTGDSASLRFPTRDEIWLRSFAYFSESVIQESLSMQLFKVFSREAPEQYVSWNLNYDGSGTYSIELKYFIKGSLVQKKDFDLGKDFLLAGDFNQWHELILRVKAGTGGSSRIQLWRNGEIYTNETDLDISAPGLFNEIEFVKGSHPESNAMVYLDGLQVLEN